LGGAAKDQTQIEIRFFGKIRVGSAPTRSAPISFPHIGSLTERATDVGLRAKILLVVCCYQQTPGTLALDLLPPFQAMESPGEYVAKILLAWCYQEITLASVAVIKSY
jgi:hypothetical protein